MFPKPVTALAVLALTTTFATAGEVDLKSLQPLEAKATKKKGGAYVGVFVGNTISQSTEMSIDYVDHSLSYDVLDDSDNLIAGFEVGYEWRTRYPVTIGLEFEAFYGSSEINALASTQANQGVPILLSDAATIKTDASYVAFMLNGTFALDLRRYRPQLGPIIPRFRPYLGAGIGGAQLWYRNQKIQTYGDILAIPTASSASPFSLDEFVFAYQVFGGLEYKVNEKFGIYGEFRRLNFAKTNDLGKFETDMLLGGIHIHY